MHCLTQDISVIYWSCSRVLTLLLSPLPTRRTNHCACDFLLSSSKAINLHSAFCTLRLPVFFLLASTSIARAPGTPQQFRHPQQPRNEPLEEHAPAKEPPPKEKNPPADLALYCTRSPVYYCSIPTPIANPSPPPSSSSSIHPIPSTTTEIHPLPPPLPTTITTTTTTISRQPLHTRCSPHRPTLLPATDSNTDATRRRAVAPGEFSSEDRQSRRRRTTRFLAPRPEKVNSTARLSGLLFPVPFSSITTPASFSSLSIARSLALFCLVHSLPARFLASFFFCPSPALRLEPLAIAAAAAGYLSPVSSHLARYPSAPASPDSIRFASHAPGSKPDALRRCTFRQVFAPHPCAAL